ncbi:NAD-dependent epimerase [Pseudoxanthomonas sp. SGD-10]|nr:NAD-dependent epimerase [Pseudoxanthomonas sp. SGD-10]
MKILVTGAAGFIGFHTTQRLASAGHEIVGIDNLNNYYDVGLKHARLAQLEVHKNFRFIKMDLSDRSEISKLFHVERFDVVLHLGAQAGVRYSLENPFAYLDSNLAGTLTILEGCRHTKVGHLVYASSSSVYGSNTKQPFSTEDRTDSPISLYAATKKSNELMCQTYAHLYGLPITGLRFFTVYGPWGRPDMAYYKFADAISKGRPIQVYNNGEMKRDFTYVDDVIDGIEKIVTAAPLAAKRTPSHVVYNLGNSRPEKLGDLIEIIEDCLGKRAEKILLPMQPGDVKSTYADIDSTAVDYGFSPKVSLREGIKQFSQWYKTYHRM